MFGTLTPDGTLDLDSRSISFFDCEIIHENVRKRRQRRCKKSEAGEDPVATARKLLRRKTDSCEELEWFAFRNDHEAHDRELRERVQSSFAGKFAALQEQLSARFGEPAKTGAKQHKLVPCNGILEYAIWNVRDKSLFTAVSFEDIGLPFVLVLGVTQ